MKILIISDIHENFDNLSRVLQKIPKLWVEKIFCLGDLINGWIGRMLAWQDIPTHLIWWNNDGNKTAVMKAFYKADNGSIVANNEFDTCEIDGKKIFMTHYPLIAGSIAKSGDYDAVFYGHDHYKYQEMRWDCLLFNPGEISAHKTGICSYGVYNTDTNTAEIFELESPVFTHSDASRAYMKSLNFEFWQTKSHKL